ncbi:MAG: hypothetical protein A2418_00050 [Candidatus Brennerbacteria bacterium RIFOXYC1_FULL_41_11]|uniref:Uncharacterized protein n=1 Tax=Candidatus Brennerbacteria bacterium RIFOXYD1_FULL_41_16 TaxID=1797529 RepID=A0A1G1XLN4_9BACT|nr:MAG: hypothetical protein UU61_C0026G0008 [Parcubacteria group bacterium GW2011_GWB1_41_4]OGY38643.1 MAG: hypothetical protein A2391_00400 [Candidatus Brennerbacteria bacterium RIFOXYB1_FULL_41_13]OGY40608.1 MAG: hypothetical protein A2418_00050 [Candidatus Brennerbacteria bacterium RIFOXYC1_FULL_41_11]OGY40993.1 MAG: hypothetical protein A2570_01670 [Candidatus Brennerbacteria bacterium RIFOXYD1_FULL_41_16]
MSIIGSFVRSFDDTTSFSLKSYAGCDLGISSILLDKFLEKNGKLNSGKRLKAHELSGKENVEEIIVLKNLNHDLGDLTAWQVKDILDDLGFNIGVLISHAFSSDFTVAMGIGKFSIPFYGLIPKLFGVFTSRFQKLLYFKLSPGKRRLHARFFEMHDGSWAVVAHIENNIFSLNILRTLMTHIPAGKGDYVNGTKLMFELLMEFDRCLKSHRVVRFENIKSIVEKY